MCLRCCHCVCLCALTLCVYIRLNMFAVLKFCAIRKREHNHNEVWKRALKSVEKIDYNVNDGPVEK